MAYPQCLRVLKTGSDPAIEAENMAISATPEWAALQAHATELKATHLRDLFIADPERTEKFIVEAGDLLLDLSRNIITERTVELLTALAERADVSKWVSIMLKGELVNPTEHAPVSHTLLRSAVDRHALSTTPSTATTAESKATDERRVLGETYAQQALRSEPADETAVTTDELNALAELARMESFVHSLQSGEWAGHTNRAIRTVVNLGIGGSHLGPATAYEALAAFRHSRLRCRFVANVDPVDLNMILQRLDPAETLFVVVSKSFETPETLMNAQVARDWIISTLGGAAVKRHFVAVSASPAVASGCLGIPHENTFAMCDGVGGRFSLASTASLSFALGVGFANFRQMLQGMRIVDKHFGDHPLRSNAPVLMGLLAVWYRNFWDLPSRVILPYSQRLHAMPAYLQQLEMESNGKKVRIDGRAVDHHTSPVVWGGAGTNGQHSFHQMLHQGSTVVPADFIVFANPDTDVAALPHTARHHDTLVANCLAQASALAFGSDEQDTHRELPGNRPATLIIAPRLTPSIFGQLVALYEHQVVVQGVVWDINSFDQFGVEHGKQLAESLLEDLCHSRSYNDGHNDEHDSSHKHDPATGSSLCRIMQLRKESKKLNSI
ncbi:MAG: glucose-6-phosphate isomerase [Acidimicrobiaceae bacterium]|nr:glucose-6-phosphate isomerase [Acidimicrobiaceae bacterium]